MSPESHSSSKCLSNKAAHNMSQSRCACTTTLAFGTGNTGRSTSTLSGCSSIERVSGDTKSRRLGSTLSTLKGKAMVSTFGP
eukprot:6492783-Amphidinium_carterae.1